MPWLPAFPCVIRGLSAGSIPIIFISGLNALSALPTPDIVPPVPKDQTKMSIFPSVSLIIS